MIQGNEYNESLAQRIQQLINISGLGTSLFAEFISISDSHLYSILNGNRNVSLATIEKVKQVLPFKKADFTQLNRKVKISNIDFSYLNKFKDENKNRIREENLLDITLNRELDRTDGLFKIPISIKYIIEFLYEETGKKYKSKALSQKLTYWVTTNKLKSQKQPIILENGQRGKREVYFYWK